MTLLVNNSRRQTLYPTNVGGGAIGSYRQRYDEVITYCIDYSSWLNDKEAISSSIITATSGAETLVTISQVEIEDGNKLLFQISGGLDENKYAITIETTTETDQLKVDVFYVSIGTKDATLTFPAVDSLVAEAQTYRNQAQTYSVSASASATSASSSASSALISATNASASASVSTTKASEASASATSAAASAATATTKENEASTSATSASTSAATATVKASEAASSASNAASSASDAAAKAAESATSATSAASSAGSASASSSNAIVSATNAASSATDANTAKIAAQSAQTAAESARDATLAAYDNFDDRYLGQKSSDPTLDNDGNSLVGGALYFNSTDGIMKVYTGSSWVAAYVSGSSSGMLIAVNNLADVSSISSARTNLGLSSIATIVPGTNVANALSNATNASNGIVQLTSAGKLPALDGSLLTGLLTSVNNSNWSGTQLAIANGGTGATDAAGARTALGLGTAATEAATSFLQTANNLSDVTAATARSNLGLGTVATLNTTAVLQSANNLSDLGNVTTARTNLGLSALATTTPGTGVATALGVNTGTAGAFVVNGGALGTPASGNLANCTFPTLNQNTTGTAAGLSATLGVASGGTGLTSLTAGYIPYGNGTGAFGNNAYFTYSTSNGLQVSSAGSSNRLLTVNSSYDRADIFLLSGPTYAVRFGTNSVGSLLEGVDYTGSGSYQPFSVGGSIVQFAISGTEKMRIASDGSVGINYTNMSALGAKLYCYGYSGFGSSANGSVSLGSRTNWTSTFENTSGGYGLGINVNAATGVVIAQSQRFDGTATAYDIALNPLGGNVGIGTNSPGAKLVIEGGTSEDQFRLGTGANYYRIGRESVSTGYLTFYGTQSGANGYVFSGVNGERMRIDSSGNLLTGGKTSATSNGGDVQVSKGISFPATQIACSDVNTLDDYEEGTWTPSLGGTATYTVNEGAYRKIGNLVILTGKIVVNTIGTGSATTISGLPFTVSATANSALGKSIVGYYSGIATSLVSFTFDPGNGLTSMASVGNASASSTATNLPNIFQNGARVDFTTIYFAA